MRFQTLKGSLQTRYHSSNFRGVARVSNPQRISTNSFM
ncbi:MAG: hypothetical protein MjAS7_1984 [Metallosphaera javensis (ex Sakai et al. 2022)]|nr:MAG: hypothetical protein MjAS7_1984 [Metallosphaera javensis (ex Sakai et al. 2022)]